MSYIKDEFTQLPQFKDIGSYIKIVSDAVADVNAFVRNFPDCKTEQNELATKSANQTTEALKYLLAAITVCNIAYVKGQSALNRRSKAALVRQAKFLFAQLKISLPPFFTKVLDDFLVS